VGSIELTAQPVSSVARRHRRTAQQNGGVAMMATGTAAAGSGRRWVSSSCSSLIGVVVWVLIAVNNRAHHGHAPDASAADSGGRARSRQVLDERYARGRWPLTSTPSDCTRWGT